MDIQSPYLAFAVFCERVLIEADGTVSLVRVIERAVRHQAHNPERRKPVIRITLATGLRSGDFTGKGKLRISATSPAGKALDPTIEMEVNLPGGDIGANTVIEMNLPVEEDGTYWFEISFEGRLLTRVPLTVLPSATTKPGVPRPHQDRPASEQKR